MMWMKVIFKLFNLSFSGTLEYLESLMGRKKDKKNVNDILDVALVEELGEFHSDSEDSEEYHDFVDETALEDYDTPIDSEENGLNVFVLFKQRFEGNFKARLQPSS